MYVSTPDGLKAVSRKAWPFAGSGSPTTPTGRHFPQTSLDLVGLALSQSYETLYRSQPWVHVTVNKLARGVARVPWRAMNVDENGALAPANELEGLPRLLSRPNPRLSGFGLREALTAYRALYGRALAWKYREGAGQPVSELLPLNPRWISIENTDGVSFYHYDGPEGRRVFFAEDVIALEWWSPDGRGVSPLEPLRRTLALEDAGQRYAISSFANAARPAGALVTPNRLEPDQRLDLRREIEGLYSGVDNAFRIALLDGGLDWKTFAHTAQEAQTIEHRKLNREEVAAVYDLPPPMIHILDRATFSNIDEQHRMLYQDSLGPWFTSTEEDFGVQLIEPEPSFAGMTIAFDLTQLLRGDPVKEAEAIATRRTSGVTSANEERSRLGLAKVDDPRADALLFPLNMVAIGEGVEDVPATTDPAFAGLLAIAAALKNAAGADSEAIRALADGYALAAETHASDDARHGEALAVLRLIAEKETPTPIVEIKEGAVRVEFAEGAIDASTEVHPAAIEIPLTVNARGGKTTKRFIRDAAGVLIGSDEEET